jgi:hypothetical protein
VSWENELYVIKLKALSGREYSKKMSLDEIKDYLEITAYNRTYNEYINLDCFTSPRIQPL